MTRPTINGLRGMAATIAPILPRRMFASTPVIGVLRRQPRYDIPESGTQSRRSPQRGSSIADDTRPPFPRIRDTINPQSENRWSKFEKGESSRPPQRRSFGLKQPMATTGGEETRGLRRSGERGEGTGRVARGCRHDRFEREPEPTKSKASGPRLPKRAWEPTKKLTFQAMAALRTLHANDPKTFDKETLSQRYGISYDAVSRILRSKYQDRQAIDTGEKIQGTKWDMNPATSRLSPVPAIQRAFEMRHQARGSGDGASPGEGKAK